MKAYAAEKLFGQRGKIYWANFKRENDWRHNPWKEFYLEVCRVRRTINQLAQWVFYCQLGIIACCFFG